MPATETRPAKRLAPRHGPRTQRVAGAPPRVLREVRGSRAPLSTKRRATARLKVGVTRDGCRASAGRPPGEGRPNLFQRCPAPARAVRRTRWKRPPKRCDTVTRKAVETTGGGRSRPRTTDAPRHRRAASRSGGASSAERDGRPVFRRNTLIHAAPHQSKNLSCFPCMVRLGALVL
jgi:hypothetical protein